MAATFQLFLCLLPLSIAFSTDMLGKQDYRKASEVEVSDFAFRGTVGSCGKFECNPSDSGVHMAEGVCVHYAGNLQFYLQDCPVYKGVENHCKLSKPLESEDHHCVNETRTMDSYPGEDCNSDKDCLYGHCGTLNNKPRCIGQSHGGSCSISDQCNPGLWCSNGSCEPQVGTGQPCLKDEMCQNNHGCNVTDATGGKCVPYLSVANGDYVSHCHEQGRYLCQTTTCIMTNLPYIGYCTDAPKSSTALPVSCKEDSDCVGTSGKDIFESKCHCGLNPTGTAYCSLFMGDPIGQALIADWNRLFKVNATNTCNTMRRFLPACLHSLETTDAFDVYKNAMHFNEYPQLQGNDNCIKKVFTWEYWYMGGEALVASLLALLVLQ